MREPEIEICKDGYGNPIENYMVTYDRYHTGVNCWVWDAFKTSTGNQRDSVIIGNAIAACAYAYGCALEAIENGHHADPIAAFNNSSGCYQLTSYGLNNLYLEWLEKQRKLDLAELELRLRVKQAHESIGLSGDAWRRVKPAETSILSASDLRIQNSPGISIDRNLLENLGEPISHKAKRGDIFNKTAGPIGQLAVHGAIQQDHIDGIIGSINSGSFYHNDCEELLARLAVHDFFALVEMPEYEFFTGKSKCSYPILYLFTREAHMQNFLSENPECGFRQPITISMDKIFKKLFPDEPFEIHLNIGNYIFEVYIPVNLVDIIYNYTMHGSEKMLFWKTIYGLVPNSRINL